MIYVAITFVVLVVLNIYCSAVCKRLFYQSKESAMVEKAQLAAAKIGTLDVLTPSSVSEVVAQMSSLKVTQLVITDHAGVVLYDSGPESTVGQPTSQDSIVTALECNDVFNWFYHDGVMRSEAATPVISYGITAGCVYMMEIDADLGALMRSLHLTILTITLVLELQIGRAHV